MPQDNWPQNSSVAADSISGLRLVGTMVNEPQALSLALIATPDDVDGAYYKVGETLPGGARLLAVLQNEAQVDLNGTNRTLYIEGSDTPLDTRAAPPALASGRYEGTYEDAQFNDQTGDE